MFSNQPQNRGLKQQKSHKLLQITTDLIYLRTPSIQVDIFWKDPCKFTKSKHNIKNNNAD